MEIVSSNRFPPRSSCGGGGGGGGGGFKVLETKLKELCFDQEEPGLGHSSFGLTKKLLRLEFKVITDIDLRNLFHSLYSSYESNGFTALKSLSVKWEKQQSSVNLTNTCFDDATEIDFYGDWNFFTDFRPLNCKDFEGNTALHLSTPANTKQPQDMDVMLFCTFGSSTVAVRGVNGLTLKRLIQILCDRWVDVTPSSISISYKLPCHDNQVMLCNDVDMENMFSIARSIGVTHINVVVDLENDVDDLNRGTEISGVVSANNLDADSDPFTGPQPSVDLLANYCHHSDKMLMTVDWSQGISHVGQFFEGGVAAFRLVLSKYAIECGFDFKFVKNDSVRVTAVCTFREQKGCSWLVHGRVQACNGYFYLKRLNNLHSCGAVVRTGKNNRLNSELVCNVIGDRLRDKPLTRPTDVVFQLKKEYGLNVSYHIAWLGVEKARGEMYGDYHASFDQLRWYADAVMHYNPGSYVNLDFEQSTGRFKRFFISFKACIDGFNHICPLLFLDGTFLKGRFKGNLLAATGKDGNKGLFPLAFAIVDSETTTSWTWFLQQLTKVVSSARTLTFVSDRNIGLLESLPAVFPSAHHAYCLQHLQANLRDKLRWVDNRVRFGLMAKLRECAYAPTEASFQHHWKKLKGTGRSGINNFLEDMPPKHWSNAYFRGKRYGEMTSNAAESFNKWILDARNYLITRLVDTIRNQIMTMRAERKVLATNWNGLLCPKIESRLREAYSTGCTWIVSQSNEDIYEVHSFPTVLVDVGKRSCSCFQWQLNGFPCAHAVVAIQSSGRDFSTFVEQFFTVDQYKAAYSGYIQPIPTVEKPSFSEDDVIIHPPAVKRPPGRPKKNRILSRGEKLSQIRCGRCGRMGSHNRKTCKEPI